jgi:hypothetical protein
MDSAMKRVVFGYLISTHLLLYGSSPQYRFEISRAVRSAARCLGSSSSSTFLATGDSQTGGNVSIALPKSGVYASIELLHDIQQHMTLSGNGSSQQEYTTGDDKLIAYLSATDVIEGSGWKARQAFFMFLLAPRYILTASGGRWTPELNLLHLASRDLPAVGLLSRSEVRGTFL